MTLASKAKYLSYLDTSNAPIVRRGRLQSVKMMTMTEQILVHNTSLARRLLELILTVEMLEQTLQLRAVTIIKGTNPVVRSGWNI